MGCLKLSYGEKNYTGLKVVYSNAYENRNTCTGAYRYNFNGKESDPETGTQDYGFRIYNPALGRFLSVDPLFKDYPFYSPYHFAGNSPILNIDLDGLEPFPGYVALKMAEAKTKQVVQDAATIIGGALLIGGTAGAASPLVAAAGLTAGTFGVVAGSTKLGLHATGQTEAAEAVPSTYLGATLGKTIDAANGSKNKIGEKTFDLVENAAGFKPDVSTVSKTAETVFGTYQVLDAGSSLVDEVNKKSTSTTTPVNTKSSVPYAPIQKDQNQSKEGSKPMIFKDSNKGATDKKTPF